MHTLDVAPLRSETPPQKRSGMACVLKGSHSFTCTPTRSSAIGMSHTCLTQLVLIYRSRRDGRLSRPWCEVAPAEIANPALYHTATGAPGAVVVRTRHFGAGILNNSFTHTCASVTEQYNLAPANER